jgi:hypothetical protein
MSASFPVVSWRYNAAGEAALRQDVVIDGGFGDWNLFGPA